MWLSYDFVLLKSLDVNISAWHLKAVNKNQCAIVVGQSGICVFFWLSFYTISYHFILWPLFTFCDCCAQSLQTCTQSNLRKIPKIQLRAQERVVEVPVSLKVEQPVEVPQILVAEQLKQVPSTEVQYVDREVPNITYQALEQIVEVPQVVKEERLVEVPQVQVAEFIKQVPKQQVQEIPKHIPKVEMRCVEKIQNVPVKLMQEVAVEIPQVLRHEVISQVSQQMEQRVVQAAEEYERFVNREEVVVGEQESQFLASMASSFAFVLFCPFESLRSRDHTSEILHGFLAPNANHPS